MNKEWTIDANIINYAAEFNDDAVYFLKSISVKKHYIVLDSQGEILKQYKGCLKKAKRKSYNSADKIEKLLFKELGSSMLFKDGKVNNTCRQHLIRCNCSPKDFVYIGVCSKSNDKLLVTDDSKHFNSHVKLFLYNKMNIETFDMLAAVKKI